MRQSAEVIDLFVRELEVEQIVDRLRQARGHNIVAIPGQTTEKELEGSVFRGFAGFEVTRRHGELIEVGKEACH